MTISIEQKARQIATDEMGEYWQNNFIAAKEMADWILEQIEECIDNNRFAIKEKRKRNISIVIREEDIFRLINQLKEQQ